RAGRDLGVIGHHRGAIRLKEESLPRLAGEHAPAQRVETAISTLIRVCGIELEDGVLRGVRDDDAVLVDNPSITGRADLNPGGDGGKTAQLHLEPCQHPRRSVLALDRPCDYYRRL